MTACTGSGQSSERFELRSVDQSLWTGPIGRSWSIRNAASVDSCRRQPPRRASGCAGRGGEQLRLLGTHALMRKGINPFTRQEQVFAAKPTTVKIKFGP